MKSGGKVVAKTGPIGKFTKLQVNFDSAALKKRRGQIVKLRGVLRPSGMVGLDLCFTASVKVCAAKQLLT